jgi:hypothetical protein
MTRPAIEARAEGNVPSVRRRVHRIPRSSETEITRPAGSHPEKLVGKPPRPLPKAVPRIM